MEAIDSFGEWLRRRREALGLTRVALADCANCSVSALRKIEADERRPSLQLAELLARCLSIEPKEQPAFLDAARGVRRVARLGSPAQEAAHADFLPAVLAGAFADGSPVAPHWNLPVPATPLIGRETEFAQVAQLLDDPACRLLTLAGPGGIGKTRLAIEVACHVWDRFRDGVFFAPLAATTSPQFMMPAIARALGLGLSGSADAHDQLTRHLRERQLLLLLDNLEHLLGGVDEIGALLAAAPGLKLLVTSRERLDLSSEWVFELQGLPVPAEDGLGRAESYSAFQLFLQRAKQVKVDFQLDQEERSEVVRICQLVEGMPLALELAAAWIPVLTCAEIAREIEEGLDILATRLRDIPERQRSLRAVFDHSWALRTAEEQAVLRKLSIFRGGFQREAADEVAGASLDLLSALVGSSFLRHNGTGRYSQHELVRHYVGGRLLEAPEEEVAIRERHSAYYAALVARLEQALKGMRQQDALAEIDAEIDNIRIGWQRALAQRDEAVIAAYLNSMMHFYLIRGWHDEAERVCEQVVAALHGRTSEAAQRLLGRTQVYQATALQYLGHSSRAEQLLQLSLDNARLLESKEDIAHALIHLGSGAVFRGAAREAMDYFQQALEIYEELDDYYGKVWALQSLGWAAVSLDEFDRAQEFQQRSLPLLREYGPPSLLGWTLFELGAISRERGAYAEAKELLDEAEAVCVAIGYHFALLSCLLGLGQTAECLGQFRQAQHYYERAAALRAHLGDVPDIATSLALLTRVTLELGDVPRAEGYLQELQDLCERTASPVALGCYEYASAEMALGQELLEAAEAHFHASVTLLGETRRRSMAILALVGLGRVHFQNGDEERAGASFQAAIRNAWERSSICQILEAISAISPLLATRTGAERAAELATFLQNHPGASWKARQQADTFLEVLWGTTAEGAMAAAVQRGRELSLEAVVADLLQDGSS